MAISQKACAVSKKLCTLISVGEPPTNCQICSEHLATFIASGGINPPSTTPASRLLCQSPPRPQHRELLQGRP